MLWHGLEFLKTTFLLTESMITTSFAYGESYSKSDSYYEDCEHDDIMTAEDYDSRRAIRDGWYTEVWDGR